MTVEYIIIAILVTLSASLCYTLYSSRMNDMSKLVSLPMVLVLAFVMGYYYFDSLGKPLEGKPDGEWIYVHHTTNGDSVWLWVNQEGEQRLYKFPYEKDEREQLEGAKQKSEQGMQVEGEFEEDDRETGRGIKDTLTIRFPNHNITKNYEQ